MNLIIDIQTEAVLKKIEHVSLPEEITTGFQPFIVETRGGDLDRSESITGSMLIKKMAQQYMKIPKIDVFTQRYEKPKAYVDEKEVSVSFSHTDHALVAAISRECIVGIDMERTGRNVHQRLTSRMKHPDESESLYEEMEPIRIWTLKEAALKMIGTGLRKPMNSLIIEQNDHSLFNVQFDDGKLAKICSFQHQHYWISICYHKTAVSSH
jgi:phosphopantetheinyl transferase